MHSQNDAPVLAIFDHDGILVDSLPFHEESWLEMAHREGLRMSREFIHETFGMTNAMILRRLLGPEVESEAVERYSQLKEECYREIARGQIELMPGVRELLDGLTASGALLAIGSSGPLLNLLLTVESCGLDGRFAAIASVEDVQRGKPDPQVFLVAASRAAGKPSRAVVFEDAPVGIQAALAAGMYTVGVGTTHPVEALKETGAHEVVETLIDFPVEALMRRFAG